MCIIAAKPAGVDMPSWEIIENMWDRNKDGAGFMYNLNGKVFIEKGFMKYKKLETRLTELMETVDLKNASVVMHFRIATHGGVKAENCHPFPISDSVGALGKASLVTNLGVAHNGIINITPRKGISDTMEYIVSQLAPLKAAVPKFYKDKNLMKMINNATKSKLAFLDKDGGIYTVGDFIEKDGIKYSNSSYEGWKHYNDYMYGYLDTEGKWKGGWTSDEYLNYDSQYYYTTKEVMWLDECEAQYVKLDGEIYCGDFAVDRNGYVYELDIESNILEYIAGATACNAEGIKLEFDESGYITKETVCI